MSPPRRAAWRPSRRRRRIRPRSRRTRPESCSWPCAAIMTCAPPGSTTVDARQGSRSATDGSTRERSPGGQRRGERRDTQQEECGAGQRDGVGRANAEEQLRDELRGEARCQKPEHALRARPGACPPAARGARCRAGGRRASRARRSRACAGRPSRRSGRRARAPPAAARRARRPEARAQRSAGPPSAAAPTSVMATTRVPAARGRARAAIAWIAAASPPLRRACARPRGAAGGPTAGSDM